MEANQKQNLNITILPSVDKIFDNDLSFLRYSTQKRNIAYQIQHLFFMKSLYEKYKMYGSVVSIFIQQVIVLIHSIIESTLYCILDKEGKLKQNREKHIKFITMIGYAKKANPKIISKELFSELEELDNLRNCLHPQKQKDLHTQKFLVKDMNDSLKIYDDFQKEIKIFYAN